MASQPTTPPLRNCNPPQEIAGFFIRRPYSWGGLRETSHETCLTVSPSLVVEGWLPGTIFVGYRPDGEVRHIAPTTGHITQELGDYP